MTTLAVEAVERGVGVRGQLEPMLADRHAGSGSRAAHKVHRRRSDEPGASTRDWIATAVSTSRPAISTTTSGFGLDP
jgi:hypothetical protein